MPPRPIGLRMRKRPTTSPCHWPPSSFFAWNGVSSPSRTSCWAISSAVERRCSLAVRFLARSSASSRLRAASARKSAAVCTVGVVSVFVGGLVIGRASAFPRWYNEEMGSALALDSLQHSSRPDNCLKSWGWSRPGYFFHIAKHPHQVEAEDLLDVVRLVAPVEEF